MSRLKGCKPKSKSYYKNMKSPLKVFHFKVPVWITVVYCCLSIVLVPWTFYLSVTLPERHLSSHWALSWVGLDVGLVMLLLLTGVLAYLKSDWVVISSTATGSFLLADAWFDIMDAHAGVALQQAVIMALFVEIPLAIISYMIAHSIVTRNLRLLTSVSSGDDPEQRDRNNIITPSVEDSTGSVGI